MIVYQKVPFDSMRCNLVLVHGTHLRRNNYQWIISFYTCHKQSYIK